jgi:hypothetical protein
MAIVTLICDTSRKRLIYEKNKRYNHVLPIFALNKPYVSVFAAEFKSLCTAQRIFASYNLVICFSIPVLNTLGANESNEKTQDFY